MGAKFRPLAAFAARVSCLWCRGTMSLARFNTHRCPGLQDEIDWIDSRISG